MRSFQFAFLLVLASFAPFSHAAKPNQEGSAKTAAGFVRGAPLPKWAQTLAPIPPTTRDDAVVIRLSDTQAWVGATPALLYNSAVQVNSKSALDGIGQFGISFVPAYQRLLLHRVAILRGKEILDRTATVNTRLLERETGLESGMYGGATTVQLLLEDVRVGDTLWITYTVEGENPVFGKKWSGVFGWDSANPAEQRRLTVLHPLDRPLHWRLLGDFQPRSVEPVVDRLGQIERIVFNEAGTDAVEFEPSTPSDYLSHRSLQLTEFDNWNDVAVWGSSLFPSVPTAPASTALVRQLSQQATPVARASAALHWVQDEIRYFSVSMGENSHRPQPPEVVLKRRYGDCKDKSYLLVSLLSQLGIKASPVLVNASASRLPAKVLPSPVWFDHVVVRLELGEETYFVDPTRTGEKGAIPTLTTALGGGIGLLVDKQAKDVMAMPESKLDAPHVERFEKIVIPAFDGDATLEVRKIYRRRWTEMARMGLLGMSGAELRTAALSQYEKQYPGITIIDTPVLKDSEDGTSFETFSRFKLPKPVVKKDNVYRLEFDNKLVDDTLGVPSKLVRHFPFEFPMGRFKGSYHLDIEWPKTVRAAGETAPYQFDSPFFRMREEVTIRGNRFGYSADYEVKQGQIDAAAVPELQVQSKRMLESMHSVALVPEGLIVTQEALVLSLRDLELAQITQEALALPKVDEKTRDEDIDIVAFCDFAVRAMAFPNTPLNTGRLTSGFESATKQFMARPGYRLCLGNFKFATADFAGSIPLLEAETASSDTDRAVAMLAWARFYAGQDAVKVLQDIRRYYAARKAAGTLTVMDTIDTVALLRRVGAAVPAELTEQDYANARWPYPILAMQLGMLGSDVLLEKVAAMTGDERELAANEAHFYLAQSYFARNNVPAALDELRWLRIDGLRSSRLGLRTATEFKRHYFHDPDLLAGMEASRKNDHALAEKLYRQAADRGVPFAKFYLGKLYYYGENGTTNYAKAATLFREAAIDGLPDAMNFLGFMYVAPNSLTPDYTASLAWYKAAADLGDYFGSNNLGERYLHGSGGEKQDYAKAYRYIHDSAELGNPAAQAHLAYMYTEGKGVERDYVLALYWAGLSMRKGEEGALRFGILLRNGWGIKKDAAYAVKLFEVCAQQGWHACHVELATAYLNGEGVEKNASKAETLYKRAALDGNATAQLHVGERYLFGQGVSVDLLEARKWLVWAAYGGQEPAYKHLVDLFEQAPKGKPDRALAEELARICYRANGKVFDYAAAARWYKVASDLGSAISTNNLGDMYENGYGVEKSLEKAISLYRQAATEGEAIGFLSLGSLFEAGRGVASSPRMAYVYFLLADKHGWRAAESRHKGIAEKLTPAERKSAEALASSWTKTTPLPWL
jgi:TPR repeat protein/transglutaminase-like putative cysteine protease